MGDIAYQNKDIASKVTGEASVPSGLNAPYIAPAIYARRTPAKLAVAPTTSSLRRRTPDADIRHYVGRIYAGRH